MVDAKIKFHLFVKHFFHSVMVLCVLLFALVNMQGCKQQDHSPTATNSTQPALSTVDITINHQTFHCEIAADDATRQLGLSGRKSLAPDFAMVFVFERSSVMSFWMKQCLVPIDIVFLDAGGRIVAMHEMKMEKPGISDEDLPLYSSQWPAMYAMEFAQGTLAKLSLQTGQKIELPFKTLKAAAQ